MQSQFTGVTACHSDPTRGQLRNPPTQPSPSPSDTFRSIAVRCPKWNVPEARRRNAVFRNTIAGVDCRSFFSWFRYRPRIRRVELHLTLPADATFTTQSPPRSTLTTCHLPESNGRNGRYDGDTPEVDLWHRRSGNRPSGRLRKVSVTRRPE